MDEFDYPGSFCDVPHCKSCSHLNMINYFIALTVAFFFPNVAYLCLGHILVRTDSFHRVGVRLLAMSMFCRPRVIAFKCHQNCSATKCGNWTCENYHHSVK